ncbi:MAG: PhnD/SsuA/transferrin family substrate-binding protein [Sandaracinaceae bacterium]|nr:PhnD/SsuA/transferrin family substrate-binding protein [Sandaracinaceae bacterium]
MDLQLGLVPVVDDDRTRDALERVAQSLAKATRRHCAVHRLESPDALCGAFEAGTVNLIWSSPTLALSAPQLGGAVPVGTCIRQGVAHYHGVIFVRRDSVIRSVLDLRGRSMGWVADTSAAGYIFPRVALAAHGLDPSDLFSSERFFETHGAAVLSVLDGTVDAGATFAVFERGDALSPMVRAGFVDLGHQDDVRVILATPPIPSDLFVAAPELRDELGAELTRALTKVARDLPEPFHRVFGAEGVLAADPRSLTELRRQLGDARAMGLLD